MHLHIQFISKLRFRHTYSVALLISCLIVAIAATLARATLNLTSALVRKPDIAVLLLLPEEGITDSRLLRENGEGRDYLIETRTGPKLAKLKKGETQWYVDEMVPLHEGE